ncbi:MAG: type 4a pilus biogenesis protein PilO [Pseudomonadota bacterium]
MHKLRISKFSLDQEPSLREKFFFVIVLGGLMLLFVNVFWEPQADRIKTERSELNNIKLEVDALQRLIDSTKTQLALQKKAPQKELEVDQKVKSMLERKVVDPLAEVHATVGLLSSRRFSRKVKVEDITIGDIVEKENYLMVPISIQLYGRYGGMQGYFKALERIDRMLLIKSFNLRAGEEDGTVKALLDVELYMVKR